MKKKRINTQLSVQSVENCSTEIGWQRISLEGIDVSVGESWNSVSF